MYVTVLCARVFWRAACIAIVGEKQQAFSLLNPRASLELKRTTYAFRRVEILVVVPVDFENQKSRNRLVTDS